MEKAGPSLYRLIIYYVSAMLILFLAIGVLYREYSKALVGGDAGDVVAMYYLSLSHGHVLMMGAVIPATLLFLTYMVERISGGRVNYKGLTRAFTLYIIGSVLTMSLLIYKGMGIIYNYTIYSSLVRADEALFLENHVLREALYGIAHLLLGIGITWYVVSLLREMKK